MGKKDSQMEVNGGGNITRGVCLVFLQLRIYYSSILPACRFKSTLRQTKCACAINMIESQRQAGRQQQHIAVQMYSSPCGLYYQQSAGVPVPQIPSEFPLFKCRGRALANCALRMCKYPSCILYIFTHIVVVVVVFIVVVFIVVVIVCCHRLYKITAKNERRLRQSPAGASQLRKSNTIVDVLLLNYAFE